MRHALALALALLALSAVPATAWDFTPEPVCTLSHSNDQTEVVVTYDPRQPEPYAISLLLAFEAWEPAPLFALAFEGGRSLVISTDRHVLSQGGARLTVTDRGFGNVLDGLEFNATATALNGAQRFQVSLDGAAPDVAAFRACVRGGVA